MLDIARRTHILLLAVQELNMERVFSQYGYAEHTYTFSLCREFNKHPSRIHTNKDISLFSANILFHKKYSYAEYYLASSEKTQVDFDAGCAVGHASAMPRQNTHC